MSTHESSSQLPSTQRSPSRHSTAAHGSPTQAPSSHAKPSGQLTPPQGSGTHAPSMHCSNSWQLTCAQLGIHWPSRQNCPASHSAAAHGSGKHSTPLQIDPSGQPVVMQSFGSHWPSQHRSPSAHSGPSSQGSTHRPVIASHTSPKGQSKPSQGPRQSRCSSSASRQI